MIHDVKKLNLDDERNENLLVLFVAASCFWFIFNIRRNRRRY